MVKTFSAKLDAKLLARLEVFCKKYHLKKSSVLQEIIAEGIDRKMQELKLVKSLKKGLDQESRGEFFPADDVEKVIFRNKKAA